MPATKATNHCGSAAAHDGGPGAAMRAVAEKLAAHGFEVRGPDWEEGRRLTVTNLPGITCEVTVEDHGFVTWEYWRGARRGADPDRLAGLVMRLLTGDGASGPRGGAASRSLTAGLQGIVGRELKAKGLDVDLDVCADHVSFEKSCTASRRSRGERNCAPAGGWLRAAGGPADTGVLAGQAWAGVPPAVTDAPWSVRGRV